VSFNAASGANPGSYTNTAADATFVSFSRNLGVTLEADPNAATLQAIMINQCLKCHDANGALSPSARVPTTGTAEKPFGTTIAGAGYTGAGVTANGVAGGVANVNESFKTTNASYHPVTGKQNNSYAANNRMAAPWVNTKTAGSVTTWGPLISCWDCHAPSGTASTVTLTATVTAHGGATTLRGNATASGTAPTATTGATLCAICHSRYDTCGGATNTCAANVSHGPGSAFDFDSNGNMQVFLQYGCNRCHASDYTTAVARPVRAQDVHGVDVLPASPVTAKTGRWSGASTGTPAQVNARPYAFIRNTRSLSNHNPGQVGTTLYGTAPERGSCTHLVDAPCGARTETYSAGGTF